MGTPKLPLDTLVLSEEENWNLRYFKIYPKMSTNIGNIQLFQRLYKISILEALIDLNTPGGTE